MIQLLARPHPDEQVEPLVEQAPAGDRVELLPERAQLPPRVAAQAGPEHQAAPRQPVDPDRLPGQLAGPAPGHRRDHRADDQPLGRAGDGGQGDPRVGHVGHGRPVEHVVPNEQAVPPGGLGLGAQVGHEPGLGELAEEGQEQSGAGGRVHGRRAYGARPPVRVGPAQH
jgi:hypothetical protein